MGGLKKQSIYLNTSIISIKENAKQSNCNKCCEVVNEPLLMDHLKQKDSHKTEISRYLPYF